MWTFHFWVYSLTESGLVLNADREWTQLAPKADLADRAFRGAVVPQACREVHLRPLRICTVCNSMSKSHYLPVLKTA